MKKEKIFSQLKEAHTRLKEAVAIPSSAPLAIDGTIQRFEFTFELAWKAIKVFLEDHGIQCYSPKSCLKEAFKLNWIEEEEAWLALIQARNLTSHVYNEKMAVDIYNVVINNAELFDRLITKLTDLK